MSAFVESLLYRTGVARQPCSLTLTATLLLGAGAATSDATHLQRTSTGGSSAMLMRYSMEMSRHAKMPNDAMGMTADAMVAAKAPAVVMEVARMALDAREHANARRCCGSAPTCACRKYGSRSRLRRCTPWLV